MQKALTNPKVAIIILNWNGSKDTIECVDSVKNIDYPNFEILIVDNGSTDGSQDLFRIKYPSIAMIENRRNLGFAEGNNVGIKHALKKGTDYVLLLNNDTIVARDFLDKLVDHAKKDSKTGIFGPKIYWHNEPNRIQSVGASINLWGSKDLISLWNGKDLLIWKRDRYYPIDKGQFEDVREVETLSGAALLVKKEVIEKTGFLWNEYFASFEDTDWCLRARREGYKVVVVPTSKIWHKTGSATRGNEGIAFYYQTRNRFLFAKRCLTPTQFMTFMTYFFSVRVPLSIAAFVLYRKGNLIRIFCKAIRDGIISSAKVTPL